MLKNMIPLARMSSRIITKRAVRMGTKTFSGVRSKIPVIMIDEGISSLHPKLNSRLLENPDSNIGSHHGEQVASVLIDGNSEIMILPCSIHAPSYETIQKIKDSYVSSPKCRIVNFSGGFELSRVDLTAYPPELVSDLSTQFPGKLPGLLIQLVAKNIDPSVSLTDSVRFLAGILKGQDPSVTFKQFPSLSHKTLLRISNGLTFEAEAMIEKYSKIGIDHFVETVRSHPDILFFVASGNKGINLNNLTETDYPLQTAQLPNLIVVASADSFGHLSKFSNYSPDFVHVAAVGENITVPNVFGALQEVSGTSFAVARVARTGALMLAANPSLSIEQIVSILRASTVQKPGFEAYTQWGGILDEEAAIAAAKKLAL